MQDAALFYRHVALGCFHRRRKYAVLSPEWRHEVKEARQFIRYCRANWDDRPREITRTAYALGPRVRTPIPSYRAELAWQEIERMAQTLEIAVPAKATAEERRQWVAWWRSSYETARTASDERKAYLKSGGWWPPLNAGMIGIAPDIVRRTSRPGLFADETQTDK